MNKNILKIITVIICLFLTKAYSLENTNNLSYKKTANGLEQQIKKITIKINELKPVNKKPLEVKKKTTVLLYKGKNVLSISAIDKNRLIEYMLRQRSDFKNYDSMFSGDMSFSTSLLDGSLTQNSINKSLYSHGLSYLYNVDLYNSTNFGPYASSFLGLSARNFYNNKDKIEINNAVFIIGDLKKFPLYFFVGKSKLAVGDFASQGYMNKTLTAMMFRPKNISQVSAGFHADKEDLSSNITYFNDNQGKPDFSYGLFYNEKVSKTLSYAFNVGYINNDRLAGSNIFYNTYISKPGLRIGIFNIDGSVNYHNYLLESGLSSTMKAIPLSSNSDKRVGAWYALAGYYIGKYNNSDGFSISYSQAFNARHIALNIPYMFDDVSNRVFGINKMVSLTGKFYLGSKNIFIEPMFSYIHLYSGQHVNNYIIKAVSFF